MHTKEELKELRSKTLEEKIQLSTARIIEWYENWGGEIAVAFSGGKDSTVLLDLVRRIYPNTPGCFCNTGLEFPELRDFVKTVDNIIWLKPRKTFVQILTETGYPIGTKRTAVNIQCGRSARKRGDMKKFDEYCNGVRHGKDGTDYIFMPVAKQLYPLIDAPIRISDRCCAIMKKEILTKYSKSTGYKIMNGTMTEESKMREDAWLKNGCNSFKEGHEISHPLSFWTEQDILQYIRKYNLPYASVYGDLVETSDGTLKFTGRQRTGCAFCAFGAHLEKEPNRYQQLAKTHPQLYDYCMRGGKFDDEGMWIPDKGLGMAFILDYINLKWWNDGDEAIRDEYRRIYHEKEEKQKKLKEQEQKEE